MIAALSGLFDWQSLAGIAASLVGTGISFFTGGWHKWALLGVIAVAVLVTFLWINLDRANLRTTVAEQNALRVAAVQARDQAVIIADQNAATNRKLVAAYEADVKTLSVLARERLRQTKTDVLIREVIKNADPVPANCPAVPDSIHRALDGVRGLRAANRLDQNGNGAAKTSRASP